jgi:hypothetical protein
MNLISLDKNELCSFFAGYDRLLTKVKTISSYCDVHTVDQQSTNEMFVYQAIMEATGVFFVVNSVDYVMQQ